MPDQLILTLEMIAMRAFVLPAALLTALGLTLAMPAVAQTAGGGNPSSNKASNIMGSSVKPEVAPALPTPPVGPNASPVSFLQAAQTALAAGRTGEAQQSLEMAQTRLLDRSVPAFQTDRPSDDPAVKAISQALQALGMGDRTGSLAQIQLALQAVNK